MNSDKISLYIARVSLSPNEVASILYAIADNIKDLAGSDTLKISVSVESESEDD